jgi:acyl-CoA thioester hydrolase
MEWKSPARFDEILEISVACTQVGRTSFTIRNEFRVVDKPDLVATAETIYVLMTRDLEKVAVPDHVRQALKDGAANQTIDHAGYRIRN